MIFVFHRSRSCLFDTRNPRFYACDFDECKYAFDNKLPYKDIWEFSLMNLQKIKLGDIFAYDDRNCLAWLSSEYPLMVKEFNPGSSDWRRLIYTVKEKKKYLLIDPESYNTVSNKKNELVSERLHYKQKEFEWVKKLEI